MTSYYAPEHLGKFGDDRPRQPRSRGEVLRLVQRGLRRGRPRRAGKGADRAGRRARRAVPVLHRRLHEDELGEGRRPRADDGGRARGGRHPGRGLARPRGADARARAARRDDASDPAPRAAGGRPRPRPREPGRGAQGHPQPSGARLPARAARGAAPAARDAAARRRQLRGARSRRAAGPTFGRRRSRSSRSTSAVSAT